MKDFYWISTSKFTAGVETEEDIIVKTAPILKRFKGQNIKNLLRWVKRMSNYEIQKNVKKEDGDSVSVES